MNQKHKAPLAFLSGVVLTALVAMFIPASGLTGTLRYNSKAPDLDPINFSKSRGTCSVTNCDLSKQIEELRRELQEQKEGMDTMTGFTHVLTAFTGDFNIFTTVVLEALGVSKDFESLKDKMMEEKR